VVVGEESVTDAEDDDDASAIALSVDIVAVIDTLSVVVAIMTSLSVFIIGGCDCCWGCWRREMMFGSGLVVEEVGVGVARC